MHERILLTGFGPFGPHARNLSAEAAQELDGWESQGFRVQALSLPVQFEQACALLKECLEDGVPPAAVICMGVHGAEGACFRLELAARNERSYPIPDVEGELVQGQPVVPGGQEVVYANLPLAAITSRLGAAGLECELSEDAGRYLCNAVFYWVAHWAQAQAAQAGLSAASPAAPSVGFLHVPADPAHAQQVLQAARLACEVTAERLAAARTPVA